MVRLAELRPSKLPLGGLQTARLLILDGRGPPSIGRVCIGRGSAVRICSEDVALPVVDLFSSSASKCWQAMIIFGEPKLHGKIVEGATAE